MLEMKAIAEGERREFVHPQVATCEKDEHAGIQGCQSKCKPTVRPDLLQAQEINCLLPEALSRRVSPSGTYALTSSTVRLLNLAVDKPTANH